MIKVSRERPVITTVFPVPRLLPPTFECAPPPTSIPDYAESYPVSCNGQVGEAEIYKISQLGGLEVLNITELGNLRIRRFENSRIRKFKNL